MKFCKNLQRVVDISDPEWAPYWTNYKMLKKLIKGLPTWVPTNDGTAFYRQQQPHQQQQKQQQQRKYTGTSRPRSPSSLGSSSTTASVSLQLRQRQERGDGTDEQATTTAITSGNRTASRNIGSAEQDCNKGLSVKSQSQRFRSPLHVTATSVQQQPLALDSPISQQNVQDQRQEQQKQKQQQCQPSMASPSSRRTQQFVLPTASAESMGKSPGEIAFFKLLHSEFRKTTHFFERAQQEFMIREERVREGMIIMKKPNSIMVNEKWSLLAKSIFRLYKDLLLLETFCIMTYCSFSKILKKHDKVTGYETRNAFMANVVNKANFTDYPKVLEMIQRCEQLYDEVSVLLLQEGKNGLYEDERLFINMIHRLNEQALDRQNSSGEASQKISSSNSSSRGGGEHGTPLGLIRIGGDGEGQQSSSSRSLASFFTGSLTGEAMSSLRMLVKEHEFRMSSSQLKTATDQRPTADGDDESKDEDDESKEEDLDDPGDDPNPPSCQEANPADPSFQSTTAAAPPSKRSGAFGKDPSKRSRST